MTTKAAVFRIAEKHPDYSVNDIAAVLKCRPDYVRATFYRAGLPAPKVNRRTLESLKREIRRLKKQLAIADARIVQLLAHREATHG